MRSYPFLYSAGQGSITFSEPPGSGGGGSFPATGADNGTTIELDNVVLGNAASDLTDPAALLNDRRIQMENNSFFWAMTGVGTWGIELNDFNDIVAGDTIPIVFRSPQSSFWAAYLPENYETSYAPFGTGAAWFSGYQVNPGVNEPTTPRPNVVGMFWGYNTAFQQGPIIPGEAAFRFATESFFVIGTDPHFEFHIPEITTTGGTIARLDSIYVSRDTAIGFRELVSEDVTIYSEFFPVPTGQWCAHFEYDDNSDTTRWQIFSQLDGGVSSLSVGNWTDGSALLTYQAGEFIITVTNGGGIILLQTQNRVVLEASNYTQSTSPTFIVGLLESDNPSGDAILEVSLAMTTKGSRPFPVLTTAQRLALSIAQDGLFAFDDTLGALFFTFGGVWHQVTSV